MTYYFKCPTCGYYTLRSENGWREICPICGWQEPTKPNSSKRDSMLKSAKNNYVKYGHINGQKIDCGYATFSRHRSRYPLPSEQPWNYEHEAEETGNSVNNAIIDVTREMYCKNAEINRRPDLYMAAADTVFEACLKQGHLYDEYEEKDMFDIYNTLEGPGAYGIAAGMKLALCYFYGFGTSINRKMAIKCLGEVKLWMDIEARDYIIDDVLLKEYTNAESKSAYIPFGVSDVGNAYYKPFKDNKSITELHLYNPVNIASGSFENCINLKRIYIYYGGNPDALAGWGANFTWIHDDEDWDYYIAPDSFRGCNPEKVLIYSNMPGKDAEDITTEFIKKYCQ